MASGSSAFQCPLCSCTFCSDVDLHLHLEAFGNVKHVLRLKHRHRVLESGLIRLHGGADNAMGKLAHIVNPYVVVASEDYEFLKKRKRFPKRW